jgi:hypothetical protein
MNIDEKEWRTLCEAVANEHDPQRLVELVDELLKAMDKRREALRENGENDWSSASGSSPSADQ